VIATELGAVGELARESGGGLTYKGEEELVEAMERLRTEPGLREQLGERGHAAFVERWSPKPHLDSYLGLIEQAGARTSKAVELATL
jgi:glycosyltransferase involved in cell wall biosynthesis